MNSNNNRNRIIIGILVVVVIALAATLIIQNRNNKELIEKPVEQIPVENDNESTEKPGDKPSTDPQEEIITQGEIRELDISIDYFNDEIDIEYEVGMSGNIKAKYKNDISKEVMTGADAQKFIENNFLTINYNNPQSEIVDTVLSRLGLQEDFTEFSVEVEYTDNTKVEFEIDKN